jgi:hypothetical protein
MSLSVGTRLGPYEIEAPLGVGGGGEVSRPPDPRLDRTVAIKVAADVFRVLPFSDQSSRGPGFAMSR